MPLGLVAVVPGTFPGRSGNLPGTVMGRSVNANDAEEGRRRAPEAVEEIHATRTGTGTGTLGRLGRIERGTRNLAADRVSSLNERGDESVMKAENGRGQALPLNFVRIFCPRNDRATVQSPPRRGRECPLCPRSVHFDEQSASTAMSPPRSVHVRVQSTATPCPRNGHSRVPPRPRAGHRERQGDAPAAEALAGIGSRRTFPEPDNLEGGEPARPKTARNITGFRFVGT